MVPEDHGYLLANQYNAAGERPVALSTLFDPVSFGHIERNGWTSPPRL